MDEFKNECTRIALAFNNAVEMNDKGAQANILEQYGPEILISGFHNLFLHALFLRERDGGPTIEESITELGFKL